MYLFIGLYMLYGLVFGLTNSVQLLVGEGDNAPPMLQNTLSLLSWSPLVAVLAAPIVEALHIPYVGRHKTWIVGSQYAVGAVMLLMLPVCGSVTNDDDLPLSPSSDVLLALSLGVLRLVTIVHEIATDSWGKSYVHHKYYFQSSKMGTVTKGFDARLANRLFLVLTFGHSVAQPRAPKCEKVKTEMVC